jgi:outer membrane immunogenic protein
MKYTMKLVNKSTAVSALALILAISSASAADILGNKGDPTSSDYVAPISWTGFYLGGRIGYGNANHNLTVERYNGAYCFDKRGTSSPVAPEDPTTPFNGGYENAFDADGTCDSDEVAVDPSSRDIANIDGLNSHGIIGGGVIGGDYQAGRFVVGIFGSYDFSSMKTEGDIGSIYNPDGVGFDVTGIEKGDEWSLGARAGYLVNQRTLVYLLAAYTQTEYDFSGTDGAGDAFSKATTFDGVSVGGGIEFAMTQNVFLGLEYVHTFYGEETVLDTGGSEVGGFGEKVIDDLDEDKIMATLKVKLNSGLGF